MQPDKWPYYRVWTKPDTPCRAAGRHVGYEAIDVCPICGDQVASCVNCEIVLECCSCGRYHSMECPTP